MKFLALLSLVVCGAFANANENNLADSDLRSAEVIDNELREIYGDQAADENAVDENAVDESILENGIVIPRTRVPGPRSYPRPIPRPFPRPIPRPYPRTYPRPIPIPIPVPVPRPTSIACYADNEFGQRFTGFGYWASEAQQNALNECYRFSRICYARGCY